MTSFQKNVTRWVISAFGAETAADKTERHHRFLEEALELAQASGCSQSEAYALVEYVFNRPTGEMGQEVGGVMLTLAALCSSHGIQMNFEAKQELHRVNQPAVMLKIRAKQAAKPKVGPLPC